MHLRKTIVFSAIALLLLTGCATYYPQVVDIPLIEEKGDIRLNTGFFVASSFKDSAQMAGYHGTFSCGITNLLAIQTYVSVDALLRHHLQAGLGLYKAFENNTVIETYGGYGLGTGGMLNTQEEYYHLGFTQFNIGKSNLDLGTATISYGLGLKGSYVYNDYNNHNQFYKNGVQRNHAWIVEPSVFFRFGFKKMKVVRFNLMVNYMWTDVTFTEDYLPLNIGFGVNFDLGKKKDHQQ